MKVATSYFYGIRFFRPDMIPLSTAKWDPLWFQNRGLPWIDRRGVVNGLRAEPLVPNGREEYAEQLSRLDCGDFLARAEGICEAMRTVVGFEGEPTAVFIVYEAPSNPMSERVAIQAYFRKNGVVCEEVNLDELKGGVF